ncbi:expressed unknown protein [Seminavis robusta]|uniref:AAA+ ATPase domain-containing protein n=1 Tax=Seminavis robusta TaxID=568900 RepID=A0A9N8H9D8_9STRA|nr:expressed unknown protein [Seminavis robusta]|eukprot:Sro188_g081240.1 n/a (873) ;mRNA; f:61896-64514
MSAYPPSSGASVASTAHTTTTAATSQHDTYPYQCIEQILKDFLVYLKDVKQRYSPYHDDGIDCDSPINLVDGYTNNRTLNWEGHFEANEHKEKLKFFGRAIGKHLHRIPKENKAIRQILETMKQAIREGMHKEGLYRRRHVSVLVENITNLLQFLQPIDLEKLIDLMKNNRLAGDNMEGHEVVLLLGSVGSGKTTTLLSLAGTSFTEVQVDGFTHLKPDKFLDPSVVGYETSYGRDAMTRALQTARVTLDGRELVVCDTPGFGDAEDFEQEIANGLGIVRALHRARSVRPVLVLSREGMGDRFSAFSETLASVTRLIGKPTAVHLKPINYVFTNYEKRHRNCLCRQFILMKKRPRGDEEEAAIFGLFVDDIINKTTPEAQVALPLEDGPHKLLLSILEEKFCVLQPKEYFVPSVSDSALRKLKLQLQITLRDIVNSLSEEGYDLAEYRMNQLTRLALVLPEASECAQLGMEATLRHITVARDRVANIGKNIQHVKHKEFTQLLEAMGTEIEKAVRTENLRCVCEEFERNCDPSKRKTPIECETFCRQQIQSLVSFVSQGIPQFDPATMNTEALMKTRGSFLTGVIRLKEVSEILGNAPGAEKVTPAYHKAFDNFHAFVACVLSQAERHFPTSPSELQRFERQAWFLAVLIQGFLNKPDSGTGEHEKMEELENRRLKLMLRLEIKISDTMDFVANTRFPDGKEEDSNPDSLPLVKLSGLRSPRLLLLSVSQFSRLCKFLPSKIDREEIERSVSTLDKKVINFIKCTCSKAESIFNRMEAMKDQQDISTSIRASISVRHDLKLVVSEFKGARKWSIEIEERTDDAWERLLIVEEAVEESIKSMEEIMSRHQNLELGVVCGMLGSKYLCANKPSK